MKDPIWGYFFKNKDSEENRVLKVMSSSPLFDGLNFLDLKKLLVIAHLRKYQKNEIVFKWSDPGLAMYILCEGEISVYVTNEMDDQEEHVVDLYPGESFGDVALFSDFPRTATVRAKHNSLLVGICKPDLIKFIQRDTRLGVKIMSNLLKFAGKRLDVTNQQLSDMKRENRELRRKVTDFQNGKIRVDGRSGETLLDVHCLGEHQGGKKE